MTPPYGWTIGIVCNEPSHEGRTVKVTSFTYCDLSREFPQHFGDTRSFTAWEWDLPAASRAWDGDYTFHERTRRAEVLDGNMPVDVETDEDRELYEMGVPSPVAEDYERIRYSLECSLCGLSLVVRENRMAPALDRLGEAEIASIELRHLAAILT